MGNLAPLVVVFHAIFLKVELLNLCYVVFLQEAILSMTLNGLVSIGFS